MSAIKVDHRERNSGICSMLKLRGHQVLETQLAIGDFKIKDLIIERKTVRDFQSSVFDGRLFRQMYKMTGSQNRCLLIVEDNAEEVEDSMHIQAARGALLQVTAGWQIPYLFSHGISDTAELIELLLKQENNSLKTREAKLRWGYKPRRANRKQQYLLEGFSGIGPKRAKALLSHFKSLRQIFNATPEDLSKVNGISPSLAAAIDTLLNSSVSKT